MVDFFINRPILSWVIAIVITLAGAFSIFTLPIEQYPDIAPPTVRISATYTGASAETTENSVTQVIEQNMTGLDNLLYMQSSSSSSGSSSVTLTFAAGTDADTAQVQVQNKLQQAESSLPESVQTNGLTVTKSSGSIFMVLSFYTEDGSMNGTDIADYMVSSVKDQISRVDGVGNVQIMGSKYSMRIWLDPEKLKNFSLMPSDVVTAIKAQNSDATAGSIGALPAAKGQSLTATVTARSRLKTVDDFKNIILKSDESGAEVKLSDVANVELGSEDYASTSQFNGKDAAGMGIELASGANALEVSEAVEAKLQELQQFFPTGVKYDVAYSTAPFVKISIEEVVMTLLEAIALVVLIMFIFLQKWRITLIPTIAVPVVLMGTFGVLAVLGYSINTLSMFAMVLAIGLLVDDAIVVVENVERLMTEEGLTPKQAAHQSMQQITGALIGIAMVLTAVFIPMAFFTGSTGAIYRQFSVTIASAMILSAIVALTITPALCGSLLKAHTDEQKPAKGIFHSFFVWFNQMFGKNTERYHRGVKWVLAHKKIMLMVYGAMLVAIAGLFWILPTSFLPEEDQGMLMVNFKLPSGATQEQTLNVMNEAAKYIEKQPEVESMMSVAGFSTGGSSQNSGMGFIRMKDWSERTVSSSEVGIRISQEMGKRFKDAQIFAMAPSGIPGLGSGSGFTFELLDLNGAGHESLVSAKDKLLKLASQNSKLQNVRYGSQEDSPTLALTIDDSKIGALSLSQSDVDDVLSTALGSSYVNDFINNGRVKKVYVQGDASARMSPEDIKRWYVRNSNDEMVPFAAFSQIGWNYAPSSLARYNGTASLELTGEPADGVSSGTAMQEMANLVKQLPEGFGYSWSGLSYQEQQSGNLAPWLYAVSILFVFLCLAALYESWSIPFSVLLAVPIGILGALLLTNLRGLSNDIYFQVGLLTTMGLSAKNAILIVEFARELEEKGQDLISATLQAAKMRLRPILMTSSAFLLGVFPLLISSGAGSGGRHSLGTGVFGGTLISTLVGIFFVPLFYVLIRSIFSKKDQQSQMKESQ
ncbi:efflux RND transporter permease subunit [Acinetobacter qingfengensis]|uniref:Efflux pump membrane transporter n=1 Tax=Acinetobacter qingfengensis TaxID=1262585 RepID=A0A1E7R9F9_9GAMM|nr:efflux RND transporter permease subunit [Acinetobacter qingfengensis]KAA8735421.1 efflux RND transporter permease subunit [Acinetobacter qingfengensis]OEY95931.1 multidrug efflux RND transporter permease [Acinetobacter qingfengensis]